MPEEKAGQATLLDALTTKGTAFTRPERRKMSLLGLLPTAEKIFAQQAEH
jgi:malate dehydrogenase (oxaloacetate-decarboxylating)